MTTPDTFYIVRDTVLVASESVLRNIHEINTTTAINTSPKPWTWISVGIALAALIFTIFTWKSQTRTEKNTLNINPEGQERILLDIIRHLYANFIATLTLSQKLNNCEFSKYPSEEHLLKLKVDPDYLHPELFSDRSNEYERLHNLIILFRNYNIEIDVALTHLKDRTLDVEVKKRDMKTLIFKPGLLTERIMNVCNIIFDGNTAFEARKKIHEEYEQRGHMEINGYPYYDNSKNGFIKSLYATDSDTFLKMVNENVQRELNENTEKSSKVDLISFH